MNVYQVSTLAMTLSWPVLVAAHLIPITPKTSMAAWIISTTKLTNSQSNNGSQWPVILIQRISRSYDFPM
ncbi:hypothetical protein E2C01_058583 [Portunus trituberculatus]|uniref:Secreted protein n=1 Tax=Portunus trituberculatus TaxID=210409 RepID=A0A5B7H3K5_PORTR|nr:hypothetical protein [Portunus trituberculatus]